MSSATFTKEVDKSTHLAAGSKRNMKSQVLFVLCVINFAYAENPEDAIEVPPLYYNPWTNEPVPELPASAENIKTQRIEFGRLPCSCQELTCGCCGGMKLAAFNFERRACMNLTYDPFEFAIEMNMLMNDESFFKRSVSAKNPPPACMPIPISAAVPLLPNVDFCVRLFNVFTPTPGYNLHACINFETRIQRAPVLVLEFDCVRMGSAGVALLKPEDNGGVITTAPPPQEAEDVYDMVNFEQDKNASSTSPVPNYR